MSMTVGYKPYTGVINTNSAQYKRAKAMYDEGHSNGEETKSAAEAKAERQLQELKMLKLMLGQKCDDIDLHFKNPLEADEETFIRNYMGLFDEDGDFINPYGVAGVDITGKDPAGFHKIIDISHINITIIRARRTEVFTRYQLSVDKSERLSGTWTLGQYERMYTRAFYEAVKEATPNWQLGQPFDTSIIRSITRKDVENRIVKGSSELSLKPRPSLDINA